MTNVRMLAPIGKNSTGTFKVNGRTYVASASTVFDVFPPDADMLEANGWTRVGNVGPTSARPTNPAKGAFFSDTTLSLMVVFDGALWRSHVDGSSQ